MAGTFTAMEHDERWLYDSVAAARMSMPSDQAIDEFLETVNRLTLGGMELARARHHAFRLLVERA